jgi:hypothetical protein
VLNELSSSGTAPGKTDIERLREKENGVRVLAAAAAAAALRSREAEYEKITAQKRERSSPFSGQTPTDARIAAESAADQYEHAEKASRPKTAIPVIFSVLSWLTVAAGVYLRFLEPATCVLISLAAAPVFLLWL